MSNWLTFLHCENFDLCRLCLKEPESNRNVVFIDALQNNLTEQIFEIFGIKINIDDNKPKIICKLCYDLLHIWIEMKKKAMESQVIIKFIEKNKFNFKPPGTNQLLSDEHALVSSNNIQSTSAFRSSSVQNRNASTSSAAYPSTSSYSPEISMVPTSTAVHQSTSKKSHPKTYSKQKSVASTSSMDHQSNTQTSLNDNRWINYGASCSSQPFNINPGSLNYDSDGD